MIFNSVLTIICMRTFNGTLSTHRPSLQTLTEIQNEVVPSMGSSREADTFLLSANPPMMLIWSLKGVEDMVRPVRDVSMVSKSSEVSLSTWDTSVDPEAER